MGVPVPAYPVKVLESLKGVEYLVGGLVSTSEGIRHPAYLPAGATCGCIPIV